MRGCLLDIRVHPKPDQGICKHVDVQRSDLRLALTTGWVESVGTLTEAIADLERRTRFVGMTWAGIAHAGGVNHRHPEVLVQMCPRLQTKTEWKPSAPS